MGTTAVRTGQGRIWEVPPAILTHAPRSAAKAAADAQSAAPPTYLHPAVIAATAAGYAWMLLVFWAVFAGDGYMGFALVIATLISGMMLGLPAVGASGGREMAPWQRHWRSFRECLSGRVEIWGAQMSGRAAFVQLVGMAWCLVALATAFGLTIAATRP